MSAALRDVAATVGGALEIGACLVLVAAAAAAAILGEAVLQRRVQPRGLSR